MSKQINIGGRLHSTEQGNVITGANEVLDDTKGKKQNVINADVDVELLRLDQSKQNNLTFDNTPTENSNNPVKSSGVYAADKALSDAIEAILILIPSAATALNQLADKNFVNSSIATDTATFRGTSEIGLSEAQFLEWANGLTHDMNDYVFWQTIDEAGNTLFKRYKWNGTQWLYEYTLNNSSFTADQWAAITSGITSALVEKLNGLPTNAALQQALNSKQDTLTFDNVPTENSINPVKSGGVYSVIKEEEVARLNLAQTVNGIGGDVSQIEDVIPAGATDQNKLVANSSMEAYVASIIQNITASFTLATTDGHINLTLTQVNGQVATLTLASSDIASAQALTALNGRVTTAEGNITSLTGRVSTNETDIANLQQLYNDLQQSKPVPVTALPETGQQQGVIYRLAGTTSYSDYMWNGSTWVLMATYNNAIDPRPKKASQNLVTSGGVFDNMGALDVSELNATENPHTLAQYVDLSAALAAIPTDYQKGGMSIKFVQSSDNKYVQYRLMSESFNTTESNWQGVDDKPTAGSENLVKSGGVYDKLQPYYGIKDYRLYKGQLSASGMYGSVNNNNLFAVIKVNPSDVVTLKRVAGNASVEYCFFKTFSGQPQSGDYADLATGYTGKVVSGDSTIHITAPIDANYFYIYVSWQGVSQLPNAVIINDYNLVNDIFTNITDIKKDLQGQIDATNEDIQDTNDGLQELTDTVSYITPQSYNEEIVPDLPYPLSENGVRTPSFDNINRVFYVDSVNGDDSNTGAIDSPVKNLKKALELCSSTSALAKAGNIIHIVNENAVFYSSDLYGQYNIEGDLCIIADKNAKIIGGSKKTYTLVSGKTNTYKSNASSSQLSGAVFVHDSNIDDAGLYKALVKVSSVDDVENTSDSFYIASENGSYYVYVHLSDNSLVDDVIAIDNGYDFRFQFINTDNNARLYLENINSIGNYYLSANSTTYLVETYFNNCIFQHNFRTNGLCDNNTDISYFVNCKVGYTLQDCFNHHFTSLTQTKITNGSHVLFNCFAEHAGFYGNRTNFNENLYTSHEGANIVRVNCRGCQSAGPMIADVNGCHSENINCEVYNDYYTTENRNISACLVFNSIDGTRSAVSRIRGCRGYDVRVANLADCDGKILFDLTYDLAKLIGQEKVFDKQPIWN